MDLQAARDALADLFASGLTARNRALWLAVPEVAGRVEAFTPAEASAEHTRVLLLECPFDAGIYLRADGLAEGAGLDDLRAGHGLSRWLPAWAAAVSGIDDGLYAHAARLAVAVMERGDAPDLPEPPEVTDLGSLARHLVLPSAAGGWLSNGEIVALGRALDLPTGFGRRVDRLETLLGSALTYGKMPELVGAFDRVFDRWDAAWAPFPEGRAWRERIARTRLHLGDDTSIRITKQ